MEEQQRQGFSVRATRPSRRYRLLYIRNRGDQSREEGISIFTWVYCRINIQLRKSEPFFAITEEVVETELRAFKSSMNFRKTTRRRRKGHYYWKTKNADGYDVCSDFNTWSRVGVRELSFSLACMKEKTKKEWWSLLSIYLRTYKLHTGVFANRKTSSILSFEYKNSPNGSASCTNVIQIPSVSESECWWEYGTWLSFLVPLLAFIRANDKVQGGWCVTASVVVSLQNVVLYLDTCSRSLSFFHPFSVGADPESVPVSGEQCKHPGFGSRPIPTAWGLQVQPQPPHSLKD